jgi:hypothetical protein
MYEYMIFCTAKLNFALNTDLNVSFPIHVMSLKYSAACCQCWHILVYREIRMVKVKVIFNDIRLLICLTPLQVNWVMVIS